MSGTPWLRLVVILLTAACGLVGSTLPQQSASPSAMSVPSPTPTVRACSAYAAPGGSDAATGTRAQPFRTAQRLASALLRGQTGCLRAGTYTGDVVLDRDATTLQSAPGERAVLQDTTLTVPAEADDVTVSRLDIIGEPDEVTVSLVGDDVTLERNDISNGGNGSTCVLVGSSDHTTTGGTIRNNVIHDCGVLGNNLHHGIYAQNVAPSTAHDGLVVEGNVLYDIASYAVQLYPKAVGVSLLRNVVDGGGGSIRGGIVLDGDETEGTLIEGNVIARTRTGAVVQRTGRAHLSRDNCLWDNAGGITGTGIISVNDRTSPACWLPPDLWSATGRAAAEEACVCMSRAKTGCAVGQRGALCRLLQNAGRR